MKSGLKRVTMIVMHVVVFIITVTLVAAAEGPTADSAAVLRRYTGLGLFSLVNAVYLWHKLYSRPYHIYLKGTFSVAVLSVSLFLLCFTAAEWGACYLFGKCIYYPYSIHAILLKYMIAGLCNLLCIFLQFLWIVSLAQKGFFEKNTLIIGCYDERIPLQTMFQDLYGTKHLVGQLVFTDKRLLFREGVEADFVPLQQSWIDLLLTHNVNEILFCLSDDVDTDLLNDLAVYCREKCIGYYLISDIHKLAKKYPWDSLLENVPVVERFCPNRDSIILISVKRLFDIAASAAALLLLSPLFLLIAACIAADDGFPIIYRSTRVGIHGRKIAFYKFRTMVKNAEELKAELMQYNQRPDGPLFKMENDPRITRLGALLRKTSLDELPQLWNVLRGDMSLIGPRPHLPDEVAAYEPEDYQRLECIPGISCLPQVRGRNELGFREWVNLDLEYRLNWTLGYDVKILLQTIRVVLQPLTGILFHKTTTKIKEKPEHE